MTVFGDMLVSVHKRCGGVSLRTTVTRVNLLTRTSLDLFGRSSECYQGHSSDATSVSALGTKPRGNFVVQS